MTKTFLLKRLYFVASKKQNFVNSSWSYSSNVFIFIFLIAYKGDIVIYSDFDIWFLVYDLIGKLGNLGSSILENIALSKSEFQSSRWYCS